MGAVAAVVEVEVEGKGVAKEGAAAGVGAAAAVGPVAVGAMMKGLGEEWWWKKGVRSES